MTTPPDIWNKYRKWSRLLILLHKGGESVCKDILYKLDVKDLTDGADIYKKLLPHEKEIRKMASYQKKTLLPKSKVTDTTKLDLSLQTHVIRILDTTKNYPKIKELGGMRNELFHLPEGKRDMTEQDFGYYWDQIWQLLKDLDYDMNSLSQLSGLKTDDHLCEEHKKGFKDIIQDIQNNFKDFMEGR